MISNHLSSKAKQVIEHFTRLELTLALAESCTGGLIGAALTSVPGSSRVFERGYVTYSNSAKKQCLNVNPELLEAHGAVSAEVAQAMVVGALQQSEATLAVSVTGIAGPGGGSSQKPVGLVWFGFARRGGQAMTCHRLFPGDRDAIRTASTLFALDQLLIVTDTS